MRRAALTAVIFLSALPAGCGTVGNLTHPGDIGPFGGVARDLYATGWLLDEATGSFTKKSMAEVSGQALAATCLTLDLPLSLAADTLTLPITLPASLLRPAKPDTPAGGQPNPQAPPANNAAAPATAPMAPAPTTAAPAPPSGPNPPS